MTHLTSHMETDSVTAFPADDFVDRLYASLAWEATVQLGDASLGARLVERVLRRAWDERQRFATADALVRHALDAAHEAIAREEQRRRDILRFDGSAPDALTSVGDLHLMSSEQVRRRLLADSTPGQTAAVPSNGAQLPPTEPAPVTPRPAPRSEAPDVVRPIAASLEPAPVTVTDRAAPAARPAPVAHATAPHATAPHATAPHATAPHATAPHAHPHVRERPHLRAASYIAHDERTTFRPRVVATALAGVTVCAALAWRLFGGPAPEQLAAAALAAPTGLARSTATGERARVTLPDGSVAMLGANASLRASADFASGARALVLTGPVQLTVRPRDEAPLAIGIGGHQWFLLQGGVGFAPDGDRLLVHVDSGVVTQLGSGERRVLQGGSRVAVAADGTLEPLDDAVADQAFSWQEGRLRLHDASVLTVRERVRDWFGLDLQFATPRSSGETLSLDVPLDRTDSLLVALESLGEGAVERTGQVVTVGGTPRARRESPSVAQRRRRPSDGATVPPMPRVQPLPMIPER